jgi:hypothetical protein
MMTGLDVFRRRAGSIKRAIQEAPAAFRQIGEEWAEEDWKQRALELSPEDTGEYKRELGYEVTATQITLKADAPHSGIVEYGSTTHIAHAPVGTALDMERPKLSQRTRDHFKKELK